MGDTANFRVEEVIGAARVVGMGFFHVLLKRNVEMSPKDFHKKMRNNLVQQLIRSVEGTFHGDYGFIVCVTEVENIGKGKIRDDVPEVSFPVEYRAIVFRPFKNEVLDGVVAQVDQMGCFVQIGPLSVFLSQHNIPSDYSLDTNHQPHWAFVHRDDDNTKITVDSEIRLKLVGVRVELTEMNAIGTINENYLGPLET